MQSWRKGKKDLEKGDKGDKADKVHQGDKVDTIENVGDKKENKETQISHVHGHSHVHELHDLESDTGSEHRGELNKALAPVEFFKVCKTLSNIALGTCDENSRVGMEMTLKILGMVGQDPSQEEILEMGEHMIKTFYEQFEGYFSLIMKKDDALFSVSHDIFENMNAKERWNSLDSTKKEEVWKGLGQLVQYANLGKMYTLCPSKMMSMITNMAENVSKKVLNGEMDVSTLNPMEMGQSLVNSLSPEDMEEITKTLMQKDTMENMMKMMQTSMNSLEGLGDGTKNFPKFPDMSLLNKMLGK